MSFDLSPLYRSAIGFDRFATLLDEARRSDVQGGFPPYNIELLSEDAYRITMAVAGFAEENLDIEIEGDTLTVSGKVDKAEEAPQYLHQGIAARSFQRRFKLADHVKVRGADLKNGLLHIELEREVPEILKPRKVAIGAAKTATVLNSAKTNVA